MLHTGIIMHEQTSCAKPFWWMQEAAETEAIAAWQRLQKQRRKLPELEAAAVVSPASQTALEDAPAVWSVTLLLCL